MFAAIKGANTFGAWKQQKIAERHVEQAERILTATYKARRALKSVRGVMLWGHEQDAAKEKLVEDPQWARQSENKQARLITAQAYYNRINRVKDEQVALDECLPMARALFSEELEKEIEKLNHQFWVIQTFIDAYVNDEHGTDKEFTKKIRRAMYDVKPLGDDSNEITGSIDAAVATIEKICTPVLRLEDTKVK